MKNYRIRDYEVYSGKIKDHTKVKFAVLSDLHGLTFGVDNRDLIRSIRESRPDAVLVVGDMNVRSIPETLFTAEKLLLTLAMEYPVYYSLGNHEYKIAVSAECREQYFAYEAKLKKGGIHILRNKKEKVSFSHTDFWMHGLELPLEYYQKPKSPGLSRETVESLVGKPYEEGFHILLAHNPKYGSTYFDWGADLILSGHYHGGIVRFGEHHGLSCPQYLLFPPFCCGDFHRGEQTMLVSAGMGEHTIPIRIHNPRELLTVTLKPLEKNNATM